MTKFFKLCCLLILLSGCSFYQISSEETNLDYYPPKSSISGVAYLKEVSRPHKLIGVVKVTAERNQKKDEVIEKLKQEAAAIGGDAITNVAIVDDKKPKNKLANLFANARIRETTRADVVVFESAGERPQTQ